MGYCLPAVRDNYYLSLTPTVGTKGGSVTVRMLGHSRPVAKPEKIEHGLRFDDRDRETTGPWQRIFFIPQANVIVVLPISNDQVVLHRFDVDVALDKSGLDYLFVTSQAPRVVKAGSMFTYPIAIKAKHTPVTFRLDSGPKGMKVSKEGVVSWNVPSGFAEGEKEVILTARDRMGHEVFHSFVVRVVK